MGGQQRAGLVRQIERLGGRRSVQESGQGGRDVGDSSRGARAPAAAGRRRRGRRRGPPPRRGGERPAAGGPGGRSPGGAARQVRGMEEGPRGDAVKKWMQLALGIVTSIGGFFDMGAMATSAQAGANFRYQLLWVVAIATLLVIFLVEMSGRFAAVSGKALPDAIREHFGFTFWLIPFLVLTVAHLLVLGTEIGGLCLSLHLVTGLPTPLWALPVAVLLWLFLWRSTFNTIENSTSLLGLITLAFVVAAIYHHPPVREVVAGLAPSLPRQDPAKYWAIAVSIVGATLSPYLFYFYSSGAVEDGWDKSYVGVNR